MLPGSLPALVYHQLLEAGYDIRTVQELLGQSDVTTDDDLHPRAESGRARGEEPDGSAMKPALAAAPLQPTPEDEFGRCCQPPSSQRIRGDGRSRLTRLAATVLQPTTCVAANGERKEGPGARAKIPALNNLGRIRGRRRHCGWLRARLSGLLNSSWADTTCIRRWHPISRSTVSGRSSNVNVTQPRKRSGEFL